MKSSPLAKCPKATERGFALIVTITLLVLLTVIAVGLLSLSAVSLRGSSQLEAQEQARANARMALMQAIGQLQQLAGQDTRITAGSDLIDASNVKATGIWRSWEGTDRDATGNPIPPGYSLKSRPGNPANPLGAASEGRFLGWLASPMANLEPDAGALSGLFVSPSSSTVPLVASGSVVDAAQQVHATPTLVGDGESQGAYAWWISGENLKAMLNVDPVDPPTTAVAWHTRMKSNGKADAQSFGLGGLDELPKTVSIPSTDSLELVEPTADQPPADLRKFHDLTAFNSGLLTNSATGGWRKDLSLFSENFAALPATELPSFTIKPGQVQTASKAAEQNAKGNHPPNALLYPWASYRKATANGDGTDQAPPINSWTALADYMLQYKNVTTSSAAKTAMPHRAEGFDTNSTRFQYVDQVRRSPVIARVQWIFSLCSRQKADPLDPAKTHQAAVLVTPVVTLWNPYNVELDMPNGYAISFDQIAPLSFRFRVGGTLYPDTTMLEIFQSSLNAGGYNQAVKMRINTPITLPSGASRVFGLNDNVPVEDAKAAGKGQQDGLILAPGYRSNGGYMFYGLNKGGNVFGKPTDTFAIEGYAYNSDSKQGSTTGLGMYMEFWANSSGANKTNYHGQRMIFNKTKLGGPNVVDALYPTVTNTLSSRLQDVEGIRNKPFAGAIFGFKPATPRPRESKFKDLATKGMLNTHPLQFYTELGGKSASQTGTGVYHPVNSPYDFSFQDVNGWNDTQSIPQSEPGTNSGYIVSGLTAGDGLTRCVVAELPTRPLQSLAELQHFDARNNNPIPPFQFNLIGNGSANPIFAPDQVTVNKIYANNQYYCNDDTFILNHLLFDDWFISSIAPELEDFSRTQKRTMTQVYKDHLGFKTPLANRFYRPAPGSDPDFDVTSAEADPATGTYGYQTVASQLEVEGMINVNSVSLDAWKSWLCQGRDARVPYLDENGSTQLDEEQSFPFPRTSIAGDAAAGSHSSASNPMFALAQADEFAGYRALTDTQVDALAEEIVEEIRKRGPFLSLSEFVNRRLTSDKTLAAAGTIQQALDTLVPGVLLIKKSIFGASTECA